MRQLRRSAIYRWAGFGIDVDLSEFFDREWDEHAELAAETREVVRAPFCRLVGLSVRCIRAGGKIVFFGNGGSAADAQHLATELTVRYSRDRRPIAALALTTDTSALTAIGNDLGFDQLFARQVDALCAAQDVCIGISTSGRSENVLQCLRAARARGCVCAGLIGGDGGPMAALVDPALVVPSRVTARVQEMHILLGQMLCAALERELGLV
jgi:D-sedoheptulose 7-phosphate isomerase